MIEYTIGFDGDWKFWTRIVYEFNLANGYFVFEEIPGWMRATEPLLHDMRFHRDEHHEWVVFYFRCEEDLTAFLLKWA